MNKFFVTIDKEGNGVELATDDRWTIRKDDMFYNPYTEILVIFYMSPHGKMTHSKTWCQGFIYIATKGVA